MRKWNRNFLAFFITRCEFRSLYFEQLTSHFLIGISILYSARKAPGKDAVFPLEFETRCPTPKTGFPDATNAFQAVNCW